MTQYTLRVRTPGDIEPDLRKLALIADTDDKFESVEIMKLRNWDEPNSTPHVILKTDRFAHPDSRLWTIHDQDEPVGIGACYPHTERVGIIGARTYLAPEHRSKWLLGNLLFPEQQEFCRGRFDFMIMTFNIHNDWLPKLILRLASGKAIQLGQKQAEFYRGWSELEHRQNIQNMPQRVLWKSFSETPLRYSDL